MTRRLALALLAAAAAAADWPQFQGPRRDARSDETGLNLDWKAKAPRVVWKVPVGSGASSCAVVGERLLTGAQRDGRDLIVCLAVKDGKELWAYEGPAGYRDAQGHIGGPRATPTVVDGKAYCLFPRGEVVCLDVRDGKEVWKANCREVAKSTPRGDQFYWGLAASPLVEGGLVVVQPGGDRDNSVVAFHTADGKVAWMAGSDPSGYAAAVAIDAAGRRQLVVPTGQSVLGLDPKSGKVLWRYAFGNRFDATAATPVWTGKLLLVSAAYGVGSAALELMADGDKVAVREAWRNRNLFALVATPIVHDGCVYGCNGDLGQISLRCLDLASGEMKWQQRLPDRFGAVAAEGHLFCLGERGTLRLVEMSPTGYVPKGEVADVLAYRAWGMPALAGGRLYLRDEKHVVCVDVAK
jgi:outer membrane protein assembly factor BamB